MKNQAEENNSVRLRCFFVFLFLKRNRFLEGINSILEVLCQFYKQT